MWMLLITLLFFQEENDDWLLPILEKLSTDCPMNSTTSWLARLILLTGLILNLSSQLRT